MTRAVIWCAVSSKKQADDDKDSLPVQENEARALCAKHGWEVVEVLRVPGHSRRARDIHEVAQEMSAKGIPAFKRLIELWTIQGFDVLICRDGDRFARSQSLFARVVEETILGAKAEIYSMSDGIVDKHNFRMWISMCGYKAASDVDKLMEYQRIGTARRIRDGLPRTRPIFSHRVVPKTKDSPARLVVREDLRLLWDDLYTVFVERGVNYQRIAEVLHTEYGHPVYVSTLFHRLLYNPFFWGNSALNYFFSQIGFWVFDPDETAPEGVTIYYGTHESVYIGEQAANVQAEIRRRNGIMGRAKPDHSYTFTGLLMCGECNGALTHLNAKNRRWPNSATIEYYSCRTRYMPGLSCTAPNGNRIRHSKVQAFINDWIAGALARGSVDMLITPATPDDAQTYVVIRTEIDTLTQQMNNLIDAQMNATTPTAREIYRVKMRELETRLTALNHRLDQLGVSRESRQEIRDREDAFREIQTIGADKIWEKSETDINRLLHRLFGSMRVVVRDQECVGLTDVPRNPKRSKLSR